MELEGVHYDAFISYRHADLDRFVAVNLHRRLEHFALPASVKKKMGDGKKKIERIFRDVDELPLSDNLSDPINNALANSDYLILVATPRYLESKWCLKEVETFLTMHDREHVLIVLAEGEPADSFPEILTYEEVFSQDENGNQIRKRIEKEPLAADTRGSNKKEILQAMDTAVLKLAAAIFGLNYDDLRQRHREHKIRRMITIGASIGSAVLLFGIISFTMLLQIRSQNRTILSQTRELQDKYAGAMAMTAERLMSAGRPKDAVYALNGVLPKDSKENYNPEAFRALTEIMGTYRIPDKFLPTQIYETDRSIMDFKVSSSGNYILIEDVTGKLHLYDKEGNCLWSVLMDEEAGELSYDFCQEEGVIFLKDGGLQYKEIISGEEKHLLDDATYSYLASSPDGKVTLCVLNDYVYGIAGKGEILFCIDLAEVIQPYFLELSEVSFDGDRALLTLTDGNYVYFVILDVQEVAILLSMSDNFSYRVKALLEGDYFYFSKEEFDETAKEICSKLYCVNWKTYDTMWIRNLAGIAILDMKLSKDYIYVNDSGVVVSFDKEEGRAQDYLSAAGGIIEPFVNHTGEYGYIDSEGRLFLLYGDTLYEATDGLMDYRPDTYILGVKYRDDVLYYLSSEGNYLVAYTKKSNPRCELLNQEAGTGLEEGESADAQIEALSGIESGLVYNAIYSEDKKYILVNQTDNTITIFRAEDGEIEAYLTDTEFYVTDMHYVEDRGIYILNSYVYAYIMDADFNRIAKTRHVLSYSQEDFVATDDVNAYRIPFVSYEHVLQDAEDFLGEYVPSEAICKRYNIAVITSGK